MTLYNLSTLSLSAITAFTSHIIYANIDLYISLFVYIDFDISKLKRLFDNGIEDKHYYTARTDNITIGSIPVKRVGMCCYFKYSIKRK